LILPSGRGRGVFLFQAGKAVGDLLAPPPYFIFQVLLHGAHTGVAVLPLTVVGWYSGIGGTGIAGKISGLPKAEYTAKFLQAELALRAAGLEPVNPCNFGIPDPTSCALAFCPSSINNDIMKTNVNIPITA